MSKKHSSLLAEYSNTQAPCDDIWNRAQSVWKDLPSAEIARGFVLQHRIFKQVIKNKSDNTFLTTKDFHNSDCDDFEDTFRGIEKKLICPYHVMALESSNLGPDTVIPE